ncbi:c-type cytochrome [Neobacillus jeddahensis]|uniref:c-type cytochrome n=1 Tax=Neobacillus jeddahensis TaxID=1461580 RepID=UPI0006940321|nr:c-type cytochrome [Neobacillus jeddahensis]
MKQLWTLIALTLFVLAGCSSNEANDTLKDGDAIYAAKCSACHGGNLQGAVGPPVTGMAKKYTDKQLTKLITDGTNKMPGHLISDDQTKMVVEWLMEK